MDHDFIPSITPQYTVHVPHIPPVYLQYSPSIVPVYHSIPSVCPLYTFNIPLVYLSIHVPQYIPVYPSISQYIPVYSSISQHIPVYSSISQHIPVYFCVLSGTRLRWTVTRRYQMITRMSGHTQRESLPKPGKRRLYRLPVPKLNSRKA